MSTQFKNKILNEVGTTAVVGLTTDANTTSIVVGLSLTNLTGSAISVSVLIQDDTTLEVYYLKDISISANTSFKALNAGEKLILSPSNQISFISNQADSLDVVISYANIL